MQTYKEGETMFGPRGVPIEAGVCSMGLVFNGTYGGGDDGFMTYYDNNSTVLGELGRTDAKVGGPFATQFMGKQSLFRLEILTIRIC